jgi:hypothetical protein
MAGYDAVHAAWSANPTIATTASGAVVAVRSSASAPAAWAPAAATSTVRPRHRPAAAPAKADSATNGATRTAAPTEAHPVESLRVNSATATTTPPMPSAADASAYPVSAMTNGRFLRAEVVVVGTSPRMARPGRHVTG